MAMGHGQGENKVQAAIQQSLNHPLLDSVPLENAVGIIVNFTGGNDLTLLEVSEALIALQEQAGSETEIVMGVIQDQRMEGRTQVIMIATGLGGQPLESVMPIARVKKEPDHAEQYYEPSGAAILAEAIPLSLLANTGNDLDVPAFLRKRVR